MKKLNLFYTAVISVAVLAGSSGCKHRPVAPTPIPGMERQPGENSNANPGGLAPAQPIENPPPTTASDHPLAMNDTGHWPDLFNGAHNEDREKFAADTVYFEFDRATIKSSEENKLQDVATFLKGNAADALIVEGNCDERGTEKYNLSLGERRALAVREFLANLGIDPQRIKTVTYGASKPVDPGHSEEAYSKNRRGDLVLVTPK